MKGFAKYLANHEDVIQKKLLWKGWKNESFCLYFTTAFYEFPSNNNDFL